VIRIPAIERQNSGLGVIQPTAKETVRKAVTVGPAPATSPADEKMHLTGAEQNRMSVWYSISTLLTRNLHDVFGKNDSARRRRTAAGYLFFDKLP
jgi:hypothetical protein